MKISVSLISKSVVLVFTIYTFLSLVIEYEVQDVSSTIINESSFTSINPSILINTTKVSNCIPQDIIDNNGNNNSTALSKTESNKTNEAIIPIMRLQVFVKFLEYQIRSPALNIMVINLKYPVNQTILMKMVLR